MFIFMMILYHAPLLILLSEDKLIISDWILLILIFKRWYCSKIMFIFMMIIYHAPLLISLDVENFTVSDGLLFISF